ncbi:MAG: cytochrome c biogenesis protein CcmE, partial [Marinovum sp.]|nr:cytochrome c biogenesis protein CcmE [Marinovum sp.]
MRNLKKRRRIQVIILTFIALGLSVALIGYGLRDGINYFRSPSQVLENPPDPSEVFRIGGLVEEGSIIRGGG